MSLYGTIPFANSVNGGRVNNGSDRAMSASTSGQGNSGADFSAFIAPRQSSGCTFSADADVTRDAGSGRGISQGGASISALDRGNAFGGAIKVLETWPNGSVSSRGGMGAIGYSGRADGAVTNDLPRVGVPLEGGEGDEPGGPGDVTSELPKADVSLDGTVTGRADGAITNDLPRGDVPREGGEGDESGGLGHVTNELPKASVSYGAIAGRGSGRSDGAVTNDLPRVDVPPQGGEGDEPGGSGNAINELPEAGVSLDGKVTGLNYSRN